MGKGGVVWCGVWVGVGVVVGVGRGWMWWVGCGRVE